VNYGKKFPDDVINLWPEVLGDIKLNVIPLIYIDSIEITFKNKKVWEIDFKRNLETSSLESFELEIKNLLSEYEQEIENIDFKLDTHRLKNDVLNSTKKFLKNKKLK
jgi:hypothetical protein